MQIKDKNYMEMEEIIYPFTLKSSNNFWFVFIGSTLLTCKCIIIRILCFVSDLLMPTK